MAAFKTLASPHTLGAEIAPVSLSGPAHERGRRHAFDRADEQAAITRLLGDQPDLAGMIEKAQVKARELFPKPSFTLELLHFGDQGGPPLQLIAHAEMERISYQEALIRFKRWLVEALRYDSDRILISAQRILDTARIATPVTFPVGVVPRRIRDQ